MLTGLGLDGPESRVAGRLNVVPWMRACNRPEHIWESRVAAKQHLARVGPPHLGRWGGPTRASSWSPTAAFHDSTKLVWAIARRMAGFRVWARTGPGPVPGRAPVPASAERRERRWRGRSPWSTSPKSRAPAG